MSAAFFSVPGAFAQQLVPTPAQTEGPFYPDHLPLDTDNDLIVINDAITPAVGEITILSGRILDASGQPVRNALVEIWQVDNNGVYIHSGSNDRKKHDTNFQGFGRFLTGSSGEYLFRTIKPVPYPGRTPHIHFAVKTKGREKFTTQCYIKGEPQNETRSGASRPEGRQGQGDADRAVHADPDVEDRRAVGEVRHRAWVHAQRLMLVNHRGTKTQRRTELLGTHETTRDFAARARSRSWRPSHRRGRRRRRQAHSPQWSGPAGTASRRTSRRRPRRLPEADYGFKPTPAVRSFGQILGHLVNEHYVICSGVKGEKNPHEKADFEKTSSKADLGKALEASIAYCDACLRSDDRRNRARDDGAVRGRNTRSWRCCTST